MRLMIHVLQGQSHGAAGLSYMPGKPIRLIWPSMLIMQYQYRVSISCDAGIVHGSFPRVHTALMVVWSIMIPVMLFVGLSCK